MLRQIRSLIVALAIASIASGLPLVDKIVPEGSAALVNNVLTAPSLLESGASSGSGVVSHQPALSQQRISRFRSEGLINLGGTERSTLRRQGSCGVHERI